MKKENSLLSRRRKWKKRGHKEESEDTRQRKDDRPSKVVEDS